MKSKKYLHGQTRFAFEFRNNSFDHLYMYNLFKKNRWVSVTWHSPIGWHVKPKFESDTLYLRLHGTQGLYHGSYQDKMAEITDLAKNFKNSFIYFNNVDRGIEAICDAKRLQSLL